MKSVVFLGSKNLKFQNQEEKSFLKPFEIRIGVRACGVCGTDVHIYHGGAGSISITPPVILGHEIAGEVLEIGDDVSRVSVGDRVAIDPNNMCGRCEYCLEGRGNFCHNYIGTGTKVDGGMAEEVIVDEKQAYITHNTSISYAELAMTEPLACCLHGIDRLNLQAGYRVLIIGVGAIGLLMLQLIKNRGASHITVVDFDVTKHDNAKALGADSVFGDFTSINTKFDCVIECAGNAKAVSSAITMGGFSSQILLFGVCDPSEVIEVSPYFLFQNEISLITSHNNPYTVKRALQMIESGLVQVRPCLYKEISLEEVVECFEQEEYKKGKLVITNH